MSEAETSISQLMDNKETTENAVIIDEILDEINKTSSSNPTEQNITVIEEEPQIPLPQQPAPVPQQPEEQQQQQQQQPEEQQQQQQSQETVINDYKDTTSLMKNIDSTEKNLEDLKDNILEELKLPFTVLVLFIIFSSSKIDILFINTYNSFFVDTSGKITFPSLFIKGIIMTLIFYVIKLFV
jgi:hypothetical protein